MERNEIIDKILNSVLISEWHWFSYHFSFYFNDKEHPFAKSIVDLLYNISQKDIKAGNDLLKKLVSISGKEKDIKHYEQLLQVLSEILILNQVYTYNWGDFYQFEYEPKIGKSNKNPEINITTHDYVIGLEVKCPSLFGFQEERKKNIYQLPSRNEFNEVLKDVSKTLPRDNPVKDFLQSANDKFKNFKLDVPNYISVLYIVWDDYIYEPISALLSKPHGLFESDSFAKESDGSSMTFPNVDCVIISRHMYQFQMMAAESIYAYGLKHPLDYGSIDTYPFKVIIKNPNSNAIIPKTVIECLQTTYFTNQLGAEYCPTDLIMW